MYRLDFRVELGFEEGIWVRGNAVAKTVDGEGWVAFGSSICDPAIGIALETLSWGPVARPVCFSSLTKSN